MSFLDILNNFSGTRNKNFCMESEVNFQFRTARKAISEIPHF